MLSTAAIKEENTMNFNPMEKLQEVKGKALIFGAEQGTEVVNKRTNC